MEGVTCNPDPKEFRDHAAECSEIAKRHSALIKQQYEQIAGRKSESGAGQRSTGSLTIRACSAKNNH